MQSSRAITEMILQEAQKKAEHIIQEARKTSEDLVEKQRQLGAKTANETAQLIIKRAQRDAEVNRLRSIADAKTKTNWIVLARKEEIIDNVLNEVRKMLLNFADSEEYLKTLERLVIEGGIAAGGGALEVLLNKKDTAMSLKLDKLAREISNKTRVKTKLRLSKDEIETSGGAVVRTIDRKVMMDNTFEDILKRRERALRFEISAILFR